MNSLTHLLGAAVFAILSLPLLYRARGNGFRLCLLGVFVFGCVFQLSMSGVYHLLSWGGAGREVLRRLDHAAIFVLIAATFTPIHGLLFEGWRRWLPLLFIWTVAATGIALKTTFFNSIPYWLGLAMYLLLGWLGLISGIMLWRRFGPSSVKLPLLAGLAYTVGAVAEFTGWPVLIPRVVGPHEVFHVAVLVGAGIFWRFVGSFDSDPMCPLDLRARRGAAATE